ncbi:E3 ubiquitin-protein ligase RZFP34 isoform X5 [Brassica rapa]|uniref:E3 ubiquitin-protein ligase RZFP34-like isoform X3 n=1 Tax=Brassica napus TaxID=3708 RepID=UPI0006AA972C|nr:E3 ubiquitin-protein ligase RZFP34-like isoform X3 [Brassica napus]XP_033138267.1 E3 ubiquitin-protein ligase RZFP34 isoform X5 [Brassica rapa]
MIKIKNLTLTLRILWRLVLGITGAHIIEDDARSEHHAVMKYSIADTATTKLRILFKLNSSLDMIFLDMMFPSSYARFVRQNKTSSKTAPLVVYVWGSTSAQNANFSTMIFPRSNITAMTVGYAGCCYSKVLEDKHRCLEGALHHNCPVCFEYLFDSTRDITVLRCGHAMHLECTKDMGLHNRYTCPLCSKSICDMSSVWKKLDEEVAAYKIPKVYEDKMVWILCNDCGSNTNVRFHLIAHKCSSCGSYNTRKTQRGPNTHSCSSGGPQVVGLTG